MEKEFSVSIGDFMLDLALVMPVYNEEECIVSVVNDWLDMLGTLQTNRLNGFFSAIAIMK